MKISVTQEHITNGTPKKGVSCAITLALRDAGFPKAKTAVTFCLLKGGNEFKNTICLPKQVTEFIEAFDSGQPVQRFEFELNA